MQAKMADVGLCSAAMPLRVSASPSTRAQRTPRCARSSPLARRRVDRGHSVAASHARGSLLAQGNYLVSLIEGDGIGPEISQSVKDIFAAAKVRLRLGQWLGPQSADVSPARPRRPSRGSRSTSPPSSRTARRRFPTLPLRTSRRTRLPSRAPLPYAAPCTRPAQWLASSADSGSPDPHRQGPRLA